MTNMLLRLNLLSGCLPFLDAFMRAAYGNCAKVADQKTWDTWGGQISNVLLGGKVDFLQAAYVNCPF